MTPAQAAASGTISSTAAPRPGGDWYCTGSHDRNVQPVAEQRAELPDVARTGDVEDVVGWNALTISRTVA